MGALLPRLRHPPRLLRLGFGRTVRQTGAPSNSVACKAILRDVFRDPVPPVNRCGDKSPHTSGLQLRRNAFLASSFALRMSLKTFMCLGLFPVFCLRRLSSNMSRSASETLQYAAMAS